MNRDSSRKEIIRKLKSLPFMGEANLSSKINELLFKNEKDLRVYFTSGTTKRPKAIYSSSGDIERTEDYIKWFCEVEGIAGGETVAVMMDHSLWAVGPLTCLAHIKAGNLVIPIDLRNKNAIKEILDSVNPTVISTLPSKLEEFHKIIPKKKLKAIETTGEPMSQKQRERLKKIFNNVNIFDAYGMTEGVIGVECKYHNGYHYDENKAYLEIKSFRSNKILEENIYGEIILTNLLSMAQPIIRYQTGDVGKIKRERCLCGLNTPRIFLKGRMAKTHYILDGVRIKKESVKDILKNVLKTLPKYKIKIQSNKGLMTIEINLSEISETKRRLLIKKISEINFDILNLTKTGQLKVSIMVKA